MRISLQLIRGLEDFIDRAEREELPRKYLSGRAVAIGRRSQTSKNSGSAGSGQSLVAESTLSSANVCDIGPIYFWRVEGEGLAGQ